MDNPENLATLGTQTRHRTKTIQRIWQHWVHKQDTGLRQSRESGNIGYTNKTQD